MSGVAITLLVVGALLAAGLAVWRIVGGAAEAGRIRARDLLLAPGIPPASAARLTRS